jgi:hypothetical protein
MEYQMDEFLTPPEPVRAAVAAERPAQATLARIGILGIAAAALIAVAVLAFGSATAPSSLLAAGTTGDTSNQPATVNDLNGGPGGPGGRGGPGFGHGMGGITITAISGNSISLKTDDGWTRTITVDSGTTYAKSGATIALGDLKVGDQVGFRETKETDGSYTIDSIQVVLPHLGGQVTAVNGSSITVTGRDGTTGTIQVSGSTTYTVNGNGASLADVKVGMFLMAEGTLNTDGSLAATNVHAGDQGFGGRGGHGPGDNDGDGPDASAAPSATSTAS